MFVAREDFFEGEKLCLLWRGPRRIVKELSDYVFKMEDLRSVECHNIHGTRLKIYSDLSLNEKVILYHVLLLERGMPVSRLLMLTENNGQVFMVVRWKVLSAYDETLEPLHRIYEDVHKLFVKLLARRNTPGKLCDMAHSALCH